MDLIGLVLEKNGPMSNSGLLLYEYSDDKTLESV